MIIIKEYSHFYGLEFLKVRKPRLLEEVHSIICNANYCDLNENSLPSVSCSFKYATTIISAMILKKWILKEMNLHSNDDSAVKYSYKASLLVKKRIAFEIFTGTSEISIIDLYSNSLALFNSDKIDVGIEVLPIESLQAQMSSGVGYFEGELNNVIRQGRGVPAVPLVIIGIAP